uniref:NME/NM23 family member 8 n=1 Tax=Athene cunicularia TaxID=194338 RepID=A0A663M889_ATHCN
IISLLAILLDDIMQKVKDAGFVISKIKEEALTREMAIQFYKDHEGKPFFNQLVTCMTEGPSVIMVLTKENAVEDWRQLMGPTDPEVAKETSPESIRAQFAQDILSNAVHGSSDREHALSSIECIFDPDKTGNELGPGPIQGFSLEQQAKGPETSIPATQLRQD